ncbi:MAG: hypothetical protein R3D98_04805 [Candidatus Krumholzibacteriia bacterium]
MKSLILLLLVTVLCGCASHPSLPLLPMEGAPPDSVVAVSLDRAISMASVLHLYPWAIREWPANLDLIGDLQPSLVGRAALVWGWEHLMLRSLGGLQARVAALHERAPDAVVQGCIFEFISRDIERVTVPAHVLAAFGLTPDPRPYDFDAMLAPGAPDDFPGWGMDAAVPDLTRQETQLWFFHLATLYLDAGLEAIHLGNLERMAARDPDLRITEGLLRRIRDHAVRHARRGWVLLDAHTHGVVLSGRLLLDFHSFPLRPREVGDAADENVVLEAGFQDAIYGRSRGGVTPSGIAVAHQRFLVELDNGYAGPTPGGCDLPECVWGSDEITWFARQPTERRDALLAYFWRRVPELDPRGRFQMPGVRPLQAQLVTGCDRYLAHDPSVLACGGGQAATIAALWLEAR